MGLHQNRLFFNLHTIQRLCVRLPLAEETQHLPSRVMWGLSFCCLYLNLCLVFHFSTFRCQSLLPDFIISGAQRVVGGRRTEPLEKGADGMPTQQQITESAFGSGQKHRCQRHLTFCLPLFMHKEVFCLTAHYNCADSRYEELQIPKGQRKLKSLGAGMGHLCLRTSQ